MPVAVPVILTAVCVLGFAHAAQAQSKNKPSNAHVAISLGDGTTIESKGKGSPGSYHAPNNSSSSITFNYNPKELTVKKPMRAVPRQ